MSYNFITTVHKPTAVTESVTGHFTSPNEKNLIISKCTKIEIFTLAPEGLVPILETNIYGRISNMKLFSVHGEKQELLFILTERFKYCVLSYDAEKKELITRASGEADDSIGRPADSGQLAIIDPDSKVLALHLYEGLLKIIPIEKGTLKTAYNVRLQELQVIDIVFIAPTNNQPTLAVLSKDTRDSKNVNTYILSLKDKELIESANTWAQSNVEDGASKLIAHQNGLLVVGETLVSFLKPTSSPRTIPIAGTRITAVGRVDKDKFLFGDHLGQLYFLLLSQNEKELRFEKLGETCTASTISYLDSGVVFIGSALGDSQLIRLLSDRDPNTNSYVTVLDTFANLGPIPDFCLVDIEKQGQNQIVACSGGFKEGSLRVIRNGIGITEQASIDLPGIKAIWSLARGSDRYLILSFISSTKVLEFQGEDIEETEIAGFDLQSPTLYCGNVADKQILQISTSGIYLVDHETNLNYDVWKPSSGSINLASHQGNQILISFGKTLIYFEIKDQKIIKLKELEMEFEISCLDISSFQVGERSKICVVGLWTDISLRILSLPTLEQVHKENLGGEVIPRSVLMIAFEGINYLLCSLGDGHLFNFIVDTINNTLHERKKVSLGNQPIILSKFQLKGTVNVFASSDRPTVIYSSNRKLLYSVVNLKVVVGVCSFDSEVFRDCIAIATDKTLSIGHIDDIQRLHIKKIDLGGEFARRIAHVEAHQCYALITIRPDESGLEESETEQNFIRIVNQQTFETIVKYPLKENEYGWTILSTNFKETLTSNSSSTSSSTSTTSTTSTSGRRRLPTTTTTTTTSNDEEEQSEYIVVGTTYHCHDRKECGRILVFKMIDSRLILLDETTVRGSIFCMIAFNGQLLVAINKSVHRYTWSGDSSSGKLTGEEIYGGHTASLYLAGRGDFVLVGDMMKSMALLQASGKDVKELSRSSQPFWLTGLTFIDDDTYLGSDNSYNLILMKKNTETANEVDSQLLDNIGHIHTGEFINRFHHGTLATLTDVDSPKPNSIIFATISGCIGVISTISKQDYDFFSKLQVGLNRVIRGIGGFSHDRWRSFQNEHISNIESRNFIDGDLVEQFLHLRHDKMLEVTKDMDISIEDTYKKIETTMQSIR
ncbi:UV-damaged DNA binding protein1 [Cavenderia fasciculata]|uniref:DNA damage-binding protein 1 n=1 Tax=Cavenderia fasciculata TaxID=261658 RepID=F4PNQ4_CACFS|nr:UV-damaged DNA binding protein1 [Cavenderia fasciculata]EGG23107.1 UV-damaged DNA binding protein1 [Cavenderia fasciculata]|eukprot:XP_004360958.1 UV-damaged DNA binding protein1 [Cavenderia fasciculata]